ncbi:hypothetical protein FISHEDRAFT_39351 [Fistulina hepatica ATCC 64428]|uniref:C2H2-type domain-containing protein n=1 Tax=Fistulina hepatica ATCC 64428 TaxID=1128425 RepID=A0A0D7AH62_9AGAR|nr:hypothetical protein FISHEDRAFT_39351 [Fistulina hepatica ATCC 64428]
MADAVSGPTNVQHLFTCISCTVAFVSAHDQRAHYRSDHHRYNMKRRVAGLPPVSAHVFDQKVLERRRETAITTSPKGSICEVCNKAYTTENAYRSHINSKKHKENELKATGKARAPAETPAKEDVITIDAHDRPDSEGNVEPEAVQNSINTLTIKEDTTEEEVVQTIDQKIAAVRARLSPFTDCLFCSHTSSCISDNLTHMSSFHSFFIPDAEYLIDLPGLVEYLGEKIAVGNVCIHCNGKGREFRTLEAVRKHMLDKSHCKIAYSTEREKLEISDFYDFSSSYPDALEKAQASDGDEDDNWEDEDGDDDVDEVVEIDSSDQDEGADSSSAELSDEDLPNNELAYGDTPYELVLPSGARIGHRAMKRYYSQSLVPRRSSGRNAEDPTSGAALVRQLLADKNSALVPRRGGFGAFGSGTDVVKARNRGEAREAGRHVREFRDQKRREDFKTRIGFINNNQKHFRDPCTS